MLEPEDVLNFLVERTGLLRLPAKGLVDFPHRTFQEYLAACAAGALNEAGELVKHAGDDQWHETIIIAAGTKIGGVPFGNSLVEQLLTRGEKEKDKRLRHICFALATACLETGRQIQQELRERVNKHLQEIVPPRDFVDARSLSAAGEAVLPYLRYSFIRQCSVATVAASARTLSLIGTKPAIKALQEQYGKDRRATVLAEVCECPNVQALKAPRMVHFLCSDFAGMPTSLRRLVTDLGPLENYPGITQIFLRSFSNLKDIAPIERLTGLQRLIIESCWGIIDLSPVARVQKLKDFHLHQPQPNTDLRFLSESNVNSLCLTRLSGKVDLVPVGQMPQITSLNLNGIEGKIELAPLSASPLTTLYLRNVGAVEAIPKISTLSVLELNNLPVANLRNFIFPTLVDLGLMRCRQLADITEILAANKLKSIVFRDCGALVDISSLGSLSDLRDFQLISCPNVTRLPVFLDNSNIERLILNGSTSLCSLKEVTSLSKLRRISLWNCKSIADFSPLLNVPVKEIVIEPDRVKELPETLRKHFLHPHNVR